MKKKSLYLIAIVFIALGFFGTRTYAAEKNPCLECHTKFREPAKSVHAILAAGCQTCHKPVEGKKHPEQKGSITLAQPLPGLCFECHKKEKFEGKYGHTNVGMCLFCHNPHVSKYGNLLKEDVPDICYSCHGKAQFTKKDVHPIVVIPNGCLLCHDPHANNNQNLLLQPTIFDLCTSCHSEQRNGMHISGNENLGIGENIHPVKGVPDPSNPSKELTCISCHNPHSSDFIKLFVQKKLCIRCHKELF